ncbi:NAD(P)/FAD-dependent oxidoreductase [Salibacteraceae bacterium]|nr:NAD(P)/FAD-dependent oxidoreductase [Salibacteraceae bacterium]
MSAHLPNSQYPRIVIIGDGFAGLRLAKKLANKPFQIVLIDRNNFHQFQPLFYQVATAVLAPSAISFPIRKVFHSANNVIFRLASVEYIDSDKKTLQTSVGEIAFDKLIIDVGADTNYFNNSHIEQHALPMKSVQESLQMRNRILECMEAALISESEEEREAYMTIVVVGGGPAGTEVSGALSEMKRYVLPKDYPELDFSKMAIHLLEASGRLLNGMSSKSSEAAEGFLSDMGVKVNSSAMVESFDGKTVTMKDGKQLKTHTLIWAAGIKGNPVKGIQPDNILPNGGVRTNLFNEVIGHPDIYAIGDIAFIEDPKIERGHPQVAQVAIQQADNLANNLTRLEKSQSIRPFRYKDLGSMATIGRNKAVVDLPFWHFQGFFAWAVWLFVHLMSILGVKNRLFIFLEWMWNYFTFDQSLRLVIKQKPDKNRAPES